MSIFHTPHPPIRAPSPRGEGFISPGEVVETVILDKEAIRAELVKSIFWWSQ